MRSPSTCIQPCCCAVLDLHPSLMSGSGRCCRRGEGQEGSPLPKWPFLRCAEGSPCLQVLDGKVSELEAQSDSLSAAELYKRVLPFSGMGPFTAANVLQLLGRHAVLPAIQSSAQCRCTRACCRVT